MAVILVVEDVLPNRLLASKLLRRAGHTVVEAVDGAQGVRLADEHRPALILMDLSLPEVDGWEALRRLRACADLAAIPVVALTAHAMVGDEERALAAGFDGYLTKPIDVSRFTDQVQAYLGPEC